MPIHENRCVFDIKRPENSGNPLGPFWPWSCGHISDSGREYERPQGMEMDGGRVLRSSIVMFKYSNKTLH